jgi:hypothetical protein
VTTEVLEFDSWEGQKVSLFSTASRSVLGFTQHAIHSVTGALYPKVKQLECEADHTFTSNDKVKNTRSYKFTPPMLLMSWYLIKHRRNFILTFP